MDFGEVQLPPGFRFHPTDEELVMYYLCRKCGGLPLSAPVIAEVDLYKFDPWELPEKARGGEKEWYFFSPRDRKYPNGSRPNRAAGTGYWKATGADKPVGAPRAVAIKKALVFYAGKPPKGIKTNWIMHEYRLADVDRSARKKNNSLRLDDWVLCRIYNKKGVIERQHVVESKEVVTTVFKNSGGAPAAAATTKMELFDELYGLSMPGTEMLCFDRSAAAEEDSMPRLNTDSSCSEHVLSPSSSPEFMGDHDQAESQPSWRGDWDDCFVVHNELFMPSSPEAFADMLIYLQKPF